MGNRSSGVTSRFNVLTGTLCTAILCLGSACTDLPAEDQSATITPPPQTDPRNDLAEPVTSKRPGLVISRYVVSMLRTSGSVPCSYSLDGKVIHCTDRLNWPTELQDYHRATIYHYGGANTAGYQIGGTPECKIEACVHSETVENLTPTYDLAPFVHSGAWAMDVIHFDTALIAYRFFEFRAGMNTVITHCYIVDAEYQNSAGKGICKKP